MKATELTIKTPRGSIKIHTIFDSLEEAGIQGWGLWFQHQNFLILGRDNRVGAVVELPNQTSSK